MLDELTALWKRLWDSHGQTLSAPPPQAFVDLGKYLSHLVASTPGNLDRAFAMRKQVSAPDTMSGISNTMTKGAGGAATVLNQLRDIASPDNRSPGQ